jgi:hypothetical protein
VSVAKFLAFMDVGLFLKFEFLSLSAPSWDSASVSLKRSRVGTLYVLGNSGVTQGLV